MFQNSAGSPQCLFNSKYYNMGTKSARADFQAKMIGENQAGDPLFSCPHTASAGHKGGGGVTGHCCLRVLSVWGEK